MSELFAIAFYAIFSSNVVAVSGITAVSLQSEKRNFLFMLLSSIAIILSASISAILFYFLNLYVLIPLEVEYLKLFVIVLLSCVFGFVCKIIIKKISKEQYYLYEKSYNLPIHIATTLGILLVLNYTRSFGLFIFEFAMFSVGFLLVQIIFYAIYEKIDNSYTLKPARNVPLTLYTLSIVGMILYSIGLFF